MSSTVETTSLTTKMLRALLLAAIVLTWMGAAGEARAAKPDAMCDGLSGVARGLCKAASALGCEQPGKHQKQCDILAEKYEAQTGLPPPWEEPVYPSQTVTLAFDYDVIDLETGTLCDDALAVPAGCNDPEGIAIRPPNDFWIAYMFGEANPAVLFHNQDCGSSTATPGIAFLEGTPFHSVDSSVLPSLTFDVGLVASPFDPDDTIVLRTCDGNYFKIGNPRCNDGQSDQCTSSETGVGTVMVDFERLEF